MAVRTVIAYCSDLSGVDIAKKDAGVQFSLDGTDYQIDLTPEERAGLRQALAPFTTAARQIRAGRSRPAPASHPTPPGEPTSRVLRAWAKESGFEITARGRIPDLVREAYKAAHLRG